MTTMIQAIETRYAGCRFRSRLESRWAVFFDHLGIEWEYEQQGYDLSTTGPYLPDFQIHALGIKRQPLIVEVKGSEAEFTSHQNRIWDLGHTLSMFVLVLGSVPTPDTNAQPLRYMHRIFCPGTSAGVVGWHYATFSVDGTVFVIAPGTGLGARSSHPYGLVQVEEAYAAARSARFEHGESGAPR